MLNHLYKVEETKQEEGRVKFNLHRQKASMAFVAEESRNKYFLCVDIGFPCIREGVKKFLGDVLQKCKKNACPEKTFYKTIFCICLSTSSNEI